MGWRFIVGAVACLCVAANGRDAMAQHHHHHGHSYWGHGSHHNHYQPGHIDIHHGHIDYHPGHYVDNHHGHDHVHYPYYRGYGWPVPSTTIIVPPQTTDVEPSEPADSFTEDTPAEPTFGAYEQVAQVSSDLANLSRAMCWTMNNDFQEQPGFATTYRAAFAVYQNAGAVQRLSGDPRNRTEIARLLDRTDVGMHAIVDDVKQWTANEQVAGTPRADALKRDVMATGNALHYLMVDVGVKHHETEVNKAGETGPADEPNAPPPSSLEPQAATPDGGAAGSPNDPKFGAYANVPTVSADVAKLANRVCLTLHKSFRNRPDFKETYTEGYSVLQSAQRVRDLGRDPQNRDQLTKQLPDLDRSMHEFYEKLDGWFTKDSANPSAEETKLQQDLGALGGAVHYLMVDVGVEHAESEEGGEEKAPTPGEPFSSEPVGTAPSATTDEPSGIEPGAEVSPNNSGDESSLPAPGSIPPILLP